MKFPRSAKILRSQFDVAPFAAVFFALLIFLLLGALLPVAGIPLQPPAADNLPGVAGPTVSLAERVLKTSLIANAKAAPEMPTMVIHADKSVTYEQLVRLALLARAVGITNSLLATLPRLSAIPAKP
jgi:biopolymer transport protein ExbD